MNEEELGKYGWTQSKFWSFIRSALRQAWSRYPARYEALKRARVNVEGMGRLKNMYKCAGTGLYFKQTEVEVDHIEPVGSLKKIEDLEGFVKRLFCNADGLQVLSKEYHKAKTAKERKERGVKNV